MYLWDFGYLILIGLVFFLLLLWSLLLFRLFFLVLVLVLHQNGNPQENEKCHHFRSKKLDRKLAGWYVRILVRHAAIDIIIKVEELRQRCQTGVCIQGGSNPPSTDRQGPYLGIFLFFVEVVLRRRRRWRRLQQKQTPVKSANMSRAV